MIKREHYLEKIRPFYESDLIKVIIGVRRCGKSIILDQIREEIGEKTSDIIYLNFEDIRTSNQFKSGMDLIKFIDENKKSNHSYLFFDEIHLLDDWQNACKTLRLDGHSIFITGSNSKLLSSEYIKELSGRFVSFRIKPFVYRELKTYGIELNKEVSVNDYLIWGGFPKRIEFNTKEEQILYLSEIFNTIVYNDIITRYKIRKIDLFINIVNYIMKSNSRIISAKSIADYIKNEKYKCSVNTVIKYISYLEKAYLIKRIPLFDLKTKNELRYYYKIYLDDVSLNSIGVFNNKYDLTHNFENIIYNELVYRGYNVNNYRINDFEIDFVASKNGKEYYIQAAYSIVDENTYKREFRPFEILDNSHMKIIITNDENDYSTSSVRHIRLNDFLMMEDL